MSLILAIEPNKNQAHQLSTLVRTHLKAELVTAPTAAAALNALGDRIPDLVLTPALFGPRDEEALTERLRQMGADGSHVQTLAIPILAASSKGSGGMLGRKKEKGESEVGCDPGVFADQIRIYLQRAAVDRRAQASEAAARAMTATPAASDAEPALEEMPFMMGADELDVDSLELPTIPPPAPPPPAPPVAAAPAAQDAGESRGKSKPKPRSVSPVEEELGLVTPPAAGPPLWQVTESVEDFYSNPESFDPTPHANAAAPSMNAAAPTPSPVSAATLQAPKPAPRARRTPPRPDDWAYFDPSQSTVKALIRRLDEIAGSAV